MKTLLQLSFLFMFCLNFNLNAQKNNIKVGTMGFNGLGLSYERSWSPRISTLLSYNQMHRTDGTADRYSNKIKAIHLEGRIYFGKNKPIMEGFYFAPHLTYQQNKLRYYNIHNPNSFADQLTGALVTVFTFGFGSYQNEEIQRADIAGREDVSSMGVGFNLGYQKIIHRFSIDAGIRHSRNFVLSKYEGIPLNGGSYIPHKKDTNSFDLLFYLGIGYTF